MGGPIYVSGEVNGCYASMPIAYNDVRNVLKYVKSLASYRAFVYNHQIVTIGTCMLQYVKECAWWREALAKWGAVLTCRGRVSRNSPLSRQRAGKRVKASPAPASPMLTHFKYILNRTAQHYLWISGA
jgi:hypothetical protein